MKLIITSENPGFLTASYIKRRINAAPAQRPFVLGLPTGGTAIDMYKYLVQFHREGKLSFKNVITFNLDEYAGLDYTHPQSYHSYMQENLFSHIDILPANINIPQGNAPDLTAACIAYEEKIKQVGGIDLFIGGVGANGHIAFNEPGSAFSAKTRVVDLHPRTIVDNARFFDNNKNAVPKRAITMGLETISNSREIIIMAIGQNKAEAVYHAIEGRREEAWPITVLQNHPLAYLVADEEAAGLVNKNIPRGCCLGEGVL